MAKDAKKYVKSEVKYDTSRKSAGGPRGRADRGY